MGLSRLLDALQRLPGPVRYGVIVAGLIVFVMLGRAVIGLAFIGIGSALGG